MRVPVRVAPGPVLAGHGQFRFEVLEVGTQFMVRDGPVGTHAVGGKGTEVRGVETGGIAGEVHHRTADAPARIVGAERHRVVARITRGSFQYSWCEPDSSLTQSRSGIPKGPASKTTTRHPWRAKRWASTLPPAPQPTTTRSTSSSWSKRRMSATRRWLVRVPSLGTSQADSLRARSLLSHAHEPWPATAASCAARAFSARSAHGTGSAASRSPASHGSRRSVPRFL